MKPGRSRDLLGEIDKSKGQDSPQPAARNNQVWANLAGLCTAWRESAKQRSMPTEFAPTLHGMTSTPVHGSPGPACPLPNMFRTRRGERGALIKERSGRRAHRPLMACRPPCARRACLCAATAPKRLVHHNVGPYSRGPLPFPRPAGARPPRRVESALPWPRCKRSVDARWRAAPGMGAMCKAAWCWPNAASRGRPQRGRQPRKRMVGASESGANAICS